MKLGKLTVKHQVTIPRDARRALGLRAGDHVAFELGLDHVTLRKARPIDWQWAAFVGSQLSEWNSEEDEQAWRDL